MKKIYTTLFTALVSLLMASAQTASFQLNDDGSVQNPAFEDGQKSPSLSFLHSVCDSITTTYAAGNSHRGNMFDIRVNYPITVTGFDVHITGTTDYAVYYKQGTYIGFESDSTQWTLLAQISGVVGQPQGTPTPLPYVFNLDLAPGDYGFYLSSMITTISNRYTNGTGVGNVYVSDTNMRISEGAGFEWPFTNGGAINTPRVWNGTFHYCPLFDATADPSALAASVFPNPAHDNVRLRFSDYNDKPVTISICDPTGKRIDVLDAILSNEIELPLTGFSPGLYVLKAEAAGREPYRSRIVVY